MDAKVTLAVIGSTEEHSSAGQIEVISLNQLVCFLNEHMQINLSFLKQAQFKESASAFLHLLGKSRHRVSSLV